MSSEPVEHLSAITIVCASMRRSVDFYRALGFALLYGGPADDFTSFRVGDGFFNLQTDPDREGRVRGEATPLRSAGGEGPRLWGRVIFWVDDVDAMHQRALDAGLAPLDAPSDAPWGERYFHIRDPDGNEISFARPL